MNSVETAIALCRVYFSGDTSVLGPLSDLAEELDYRHVARKLRDPSSDKRYWVQVFKNMLSTRGKSIHLKSLRKKYRKNR